ncbi:unnamed protein product [Schistosoma turkestanicum]|nr:unnamed protein product [Schistosoma turkestanicum]
MNDESIITLFSEYLQSEHRSDICKLSLSTLSSSEPHQSIIVHFNNLCEFNSIFSELILSKPEKTLNLLNKSIYQILQSTQTKQSINNLQQNIHIRLTALPIIPEVYKNHIPTSIDIKKLIALRAIVSRICPVQVIQHKIKYSCTKCNATVNVYANFENFYTIKPPRYCANCKQSYHSMNFKCISSSNTEFYAKNYQEIYVHEQFDCLTVGVMRRSICVCLEDDLLECVKPGDEIVINGIVTHRWRCIKEGDPCEIFTYLKANYIENLTELKAGGGSSQMSHEHALEYELFWNKFINFHAILEGRNMILRSICPDVYGMYLIKLSSALMLASAPEWHTTSAETTNINGLSVHIRGNPHILLIGDPGTAKSILLRGCTALCDRAVLTTATGTTAAGLTATATRDSTGWTLDAGALVLADGGLCVIDEFTALHGSHRAAVHEAMEQQTISIAKAGLMARLNCRCSILAAANPSSSSIVKNDEDFGLPTPLLSRFDLIWRLVDPIDSIEWDRQIANFILNIDQQSVDSLRNQQKTKRHHLSSKNNLKEYFIWIRDRFKPQLSIEAANLLQRYYIWQRNQIKSISCHDSSVGSFSRRTLRLLESLVRLTKAHARLMCRNEATIEDAVIVIYLVDCSLYSTSSIKTNQYNSNNYSLSNFISPELIVSMNIPDNASMDYIQIEQLVFSTLNYNNKSINKDVHSNHDENVYANRFKQNYSNTCKNIHLEPLLSSTQLITNSSNNNNNNVESRKSYSENNRQRHNSSISKRIFHPDEKDSSLSSTVLIQDDNDLLTMPPMKSFKWTALDDSVSADDDHINSTIPTTKTTTNINLNMNKPLWSKHLSSNSFDISNGDDLSICIDTLNDTRQNVQLSIDNKYDKSNNDDDIISFGFNMMMKGDENILKRHLKSEDFEIDL